jgi:hypothetical protein
MGRGAKRFYAYQARSPALEGDRHALCGSLVDPLRVLAVEVKHAPWIELRPWCDTCRDYVRELVSDSEGGPP